MGILGHRVKERREELKLTQVQLAERSEIGQATIARIETGDTKSPRGDTERRLARALRTTPEYLTGETDDPTPEPDADEMGDRPVLGNARGWAEAEAAYRAANPTKYPAEAYAIARGAALTTVPEPVTEDFVADIVMVLWKHHRDPSIAAQQQRKHESTAKGLETRGAKKLGLRK